MKTVRNFFDGIIMRFEKQDQYEGSDDFLTRVLNEIKIEVFIDFEIILNLLLKATWVLMDLKEANITHQLKNNML